MIYCPNCHRKIKTMKHLTKTGMKYTCACGEDVTRIKLEQLIKQIKEDY